MVDAVPIVRPPHPPSIDLLDSVHMMNGRWNRQTHNDRPHPTFVRILGLGCSLHGRQASLRTIYNAELHKLFDTLYLNQ